MSLFTRSTKHDPDTSVALVFQALQWYGEDVDLSEEYDGDERGDYMYYIIKLFGSTLDGKTVSVSIRNFTPYFYVKVPNHWTKREVIKFYGYLFEILPSLMKNGLQSCKLFEKQDFWGFTNHKQFKFVRVCFKNLKTMRYIERKLQNKVVISSISKENIQFGLYESNIEPFLRFIHINDLEPSGWIRLPAKKFKATSLLETNCNIDVEVNWTDVEPYKCDHSAPFLIASFDIECISLSGDFPVAVKPDYKHIAFKLYDIYKQTLEKNTVYNLREGIKTCILYTLGYDVECPYDMHKEVVKTELLPIKDMIHNLEIYLDDIATLLSGKFVYDSGTKPTREKIVGKINDILTNKLKLPLLEGDPIIQIGTTLHKYGERECCHKHIVTLGSCEPQDGITIEECRTEAELLLKWREFIMKINPDMITGYNIFGFDFDYITERAREVGVLSNFMKLSRFPNQVCKFKKTKLSSSALGDNILKYIDMNGIVLFDLMKVVQRDHKLDSYKLDNVAYHFTGEQKDDVSPQDIFRLQKGTAADRSIVAKYCIQDCTLCNKLVMKLEIIANSMGMSNVCLVPLTYIFMRGQGIKIFSLVLKMCRESNYLIPVFSREFSVPDTILEEVQILISNHVSDSSTLAKVQDNIKQLVKLSRQDSRLECYKKYNLYAGYIFRSYCKLGLCEDAILPLLASKFKCSMMVIKEINNILIDDEENNEPTDNDDSYEGAIVLDPKEGVYIDDPVSVFDYASLYPSSMISENLSHDCIVLDPAYDNLPNVEYSNVAYDIYECKNGKKVKVGERVCRYVQPPNGEKGVIPNILLKLLTARKTTRKMIGMKQIMHGGEVIKGYYNTDSNTFYPEKGESFTLTNDQVATLNDVFNDFQKAVLDGLQNAYKITANSLYGQIGAKTSPIYLKDIAACTTATGRKMILMAKDFLEGQYHANIVYGDSVASYTPILIKYNNKIFIEEVQNLAQMFGNACWVPCKQTKEACELDCVEVWTDEGWTQVYRIIRHKLAPHKSMIRVVTGAGVVDVTSDHSLIRSDMTIVKPNDLSVGDSLLHQYVPAYTDAMMNLDVICPGQYMATNTQLTAAKIYAHAVTHGFDVELKPNKYNNYVHMNFKNKTNVEYDHDRTRIKEMFSIPYDDGDYVYDLTTENHKFAAGVGELIVHNTDSLFVIFPDTIMETTIDIPHGSLKGKAKIMPSINIATKAASEFKCLIKKPHDLEYEKTFWPFILLSKKRYVGNMYEKDDVNFKQKSMGIVLKRRDNAQIVKSVYGGIIDIILNQQDVNKSVEFLNRSLNELVDGRCPIEDLVITKSLRSEYKDPTKIAHKVLAERMKERDPGNAPQVNDRVPFVYIQSNTKEKVLQGERIEHPDFIKKNNLKIDYNFYITNQIMKPILQLYSIIVEDLPGYSKPPCYYEMVNDKIKEETDDAKKMKEKMAMVKENIVKELLFDPVLSKLENFKKTSTRIGKKVEKELLMSQLPQLPTMDILQNVLQKKRQKRVSKKNESKE